MFKIPTNNTFSQPNTSDLEGNIWYTKNINFDEKGYLKLSSRAVSVMSNDYVSNNGDINFGYPYSVSRKSLNGDFFVATSGYTFTGNVSPTAYSIANDGTGTNIPVGSVNNRATWWQNRWHVTTDTSMKYKDGATSTWASTGVALTTGYPHPPEVFLNKKQLAVGNGSTVKLFTTVYGAGTADLVLPSDFKVVGLAYQNLRMGIATQADDSVVGQSKEAYFFTWDGATAEANGGWGVGSDAIMQVIPYKSQWAILTRHGKLLYFNGGGFDELATLPFYFKRNTVDASSMIGDIMSVSGNLIYLNIPADIRYYGIKQERFMQNVVGGILCYDPKVGLYHRYSPSVSPLYYITSSSVATATGTITTSSVPIITGNPILYTNDPSNQIGGLVVGTVYYIIKVSPTTFRLATTKANALIGSSITLTSTGAASSYFVGINLVDYGAAKAISTHGVMNLGNIDYTYDHLLFGTYQADFATTGSFKYLNMTVPRFPNRGYFVTPRLLSLNKEDNFNKIIIKYAQLNTTDKIIVKLKNADVIGIPVTSEQRGITCSWTSSTVLTTTANFAEVVTYLAADTTNECEVEIITGAGAGQMAQISTITLNAGTYTITLAEEIDGASSGRYCGIIIDNWKKFGEITSTDTTGHVEFDISRTSKWAKFKIELRGVETTIEEIQIPNHTQIPSDVKITRT